MMSRRRHHASPPATPPAADDTTANATAAGDAEKTVCQAAGGSWRARVRHALFMAVRFTLTASIAGIGAWCAASWLLPALVLALGVSMGVSANSPTPDLLTILVPGMLLFTLLACHCLIRFTRWLWQRLDTWMHGLASAGRQLCSFVRTHLPRVLRKPSPTTALERD